MVLRIEKVSREQLITLRLSGRIQAEHLEQLKAQMEGLQQKVVLDLADVKLVDRDAVSFLAVCEANGVELRQCSPYIRDWIGRERGQPREEKNRPE
jgi:ABC-type transporter Mla MlaB component